jgi:hypothetical protein
MLPALTVIVTVTACFYVRCGARFCVAVMNVDDELDISACARAGH